MRQNGLVLPGLASLAALVFVPAISPAATGAEPMIEAQRSAVVEKLATAVEEGYVSENSGREIAERLRRLQAAGRFTQDGPQELADALQQALRELSGDLHFRVSLDSLSGGGPAPRMVRVPAPGPDVPVGETSESPAAGPRVRVAPPGATVPGSSGGPGAQPIRRVVGAEPGTAASASPEMRQLIEQLSARFPDNYRAKILPGNVGLLEIDMMVPPHDRLDAAMRQLADTDALIVDLSSCPGGTGFTTRPFESLFFAEPTHLMTMALRGQEPVRIDTSDDTPGGVKYLERPVYVVTSSRTGSACEEVAWCLKYHDKAIVVGETTGGAGHGISGAIDLGHGLTATVPSMRPIHPRFEGGWEGIGVAPDLTVASRRAVGEAHLLALAALMEKAGDAERRELSRVHAASAMDMAREASKYLDQGRALRRYSASFEEGRRLHVKDGELYYSAEGRTMGPLVPLEESDHFELSGGARRLTLEVQRAGDGEIESITVTPDDRAEGKRFRRQRSH